MKVNKILTFIFVLTCILSVNNINAETRVAYASAEEQKVYCEIDENSDFADDTIMVVLTNKVSLSEKIYTVRDFSEISCIEVEDLTEALWVKILHHEHSIECQPEFETKEEDFHRILALKIGNPSKSNVIDSIRKLEKRRDVRSANPDYAMKAASVIPDDTHFSEQWGLEKINIQNAWQIEKGSANVLVGVADSGIDAGHPDLKKRVDTQLSKDFTGEGDEPFVDLTNHGTKVAGIIGAEANNARGISGVCWDVTLVSLKITNEGSGYYKRQIIPAITYAIINNIPILNISYTFISSDDLETVVKSYPGLIVCCAGNDNDNIDKNKVFPASYSFDNVISVGSSTISDQKRFDSNYGVFSVDIFAPGDSVYTTLGDGGVGGIRTYLTEGGTSLATPFVTGVAALLKSYNPNLTAAEIKQIILSTCDIIPGLGNYCVTGGRLNAYKALMKIHNHNYTYSNLETLYHTASCECGYVEKVEHSYENHTCLDCGFHTTTHVYNYSYEKIDGKQHYSYCSCGVKKASGHVVSSDAFSSGKLFATCLLCGGKAEAGFTTFPESILLTTPNGSFILPNGVIVLADEDWEAYLNGTLTFTPGNYSYI